jgi:hemolysin activation/secretion protein
MGQAARDKVNSENHLQGFRALKRLGFAAMLTVVALTFHVAPAVAQVVLPPPPTDVEELRHQQQREEQERLRRQKAPDARLEKEQPVADTFDLPEESPCFQIKTIQIEGDSAGRFSWVGSYLDHYTGRCIGRDGINLIVKRLTGRLISRGYITTRIGIPEQDLSTGSLKLVLIPGVIKSIHFADEKLHGFWQTAFPARAGDLLNIRDLEQGLEQMKRVPYQDVDLDIKPGELPGESDITILVKRQKPWRGSLSVDDSGSRSTGKVQATGSLSLDNPLGINDLLSATYSHDVSHEGHRGTYGESFYYSFPYGYWTSTLSISDSWYHQTVAGQAGDFVYSGSNTSADLSVQRLVHRDQVGKTTLQFNINKRWAKTYLNDVEIEVQRRDVTAAGIGLYHRRYFGAASLDLTVNHRQGVPWLNAQSVPGDGAPDSSTTKYKIETLDASLTAPFRIGDMPLRYLNHFHGQYTQDRLFISEQFAIGGRYTVRGFDGEQTLASERGWYIRNEIGVPIFKTRHELYVGIDHGELSGPSAEFLAGKTLTGCVIGLRGGFGGSFEGLSYDLFSGWPVSKPEKFRTVQPAAGFMVTYQF